MRIRPIGTFFLVGFLLLPLAWMVLDGPKVAYAELLGGTVGFTILFWRRQAMAWTRIAPALFLVSVYVICAYVVAEPRDVFPFKSAIFLSFYAFPTGLCLRRLSDDGYERAVASALVLFALSLAGIALEILLTPGSARLVTSSAGSEISRANAFGENSAIVYLGYFSIVNIIIGLIPFTLFGLSLMPLLLTAKAFFIRLIAFCAIALAAYINIQIATRTTFAASVLSSIVILIMVFRKVSFRRRLFFGAMLSAMAVFGYIYITRNKDIFRFIGNRFADVSEDSRIVIWKESLHILINTPDGGGISKLTTHSWAHNLFLDVGLANGWLALIAVLALCGVAFFFAWRSSRVGGFTESSSNIIMLCWLSSGFLASMALPPLIPLLAMLFIGLAYFAPYVTFSAGESYPGAERWGA
jgi:hypothetical protein